MINLREMKPLHLLLGLLAASLMMEATITCNAQETGRFQGNIKGSALPGIYWDPHFMADISLGYRFNEKRYLGLGTGCHWIDSDFNSALSSESSKIDEWYGFIPAIPLFADYVRYFPFVKHPLNAFFLGMEAGGAYYINETTHNTKRLFPYLNGKLGFDFSIYKNLGVNVGFNLVWGCQKGMTLTGGGGHGIALDFGFRF